jgi:hypothetical protein
MKKLKEMLFESYAWEKKPGKPLPTLAEVQAEYESKMAEQYSSWSSGKSKFGKGSRYNDEPDFDKGVSGGNQGKIKVTNWDAIVDEYNNKPGYKVETGTTNRLYLAKITNISTGDWWEVKFKNQQWSYNCNVGGIWKILKDQDLLINSFNEKNSAGI